MRKILIAFCYAAELVLIALSGFFTYKSFYEQISYKQGLLTTVLLMIASYWFSTFFEQLDSRKINQVSIQNILNPKLKKVLTFLSKLLTITVIFLWVYILYSKQDILILYNTGGIKMINLTLKDGSVREIEKPCRLQKSSRVSEWGFVKRLAV